MCIDDEIPFEIPQGWEWCRFASIYWQLTDGTHATPKYTESGIPFLSVKDMSSGKISFQKTKYISAEEHRVLSSRCNPQKGDLLLSKVGTTGIPTIVDTDREFSLFVSVALIKFFREYIEDAFLIHLINSPLVQEQAKNNTRGVGNKNWVLSAIANTMLAIPPFAEQKRIAQRLELIMPILNKYESIQIALDKLNENINDTLKKSILQEAIQGRLVPQDPNDEPAVKLLERINTEKQRLVKEGKLKAKDAVSSVIFKGEDNKYYEQVGKKISDINEDIPHDLPSGWCWTRLCNIAQMYTGNSISESEKKQNYTNVSGQCYIGTKDVGFDSTVLYENGVRIPHNYLPSFKIAPAHSVLLCVEGGSAGRKIAMIDRDVCFGNKLCCFATMGIDARFLFYYLQSTFFHDLFISCMTGIIGGVSVNSLKSIIIPIPPMPEQKRIINRISELCSLLQ